MLFRTIMLWVLFFSIAPRVSGQEKKLDSLLNELKKYSNDDTIKANFLLRIEDEFYKTAPRKILTVNKDLYELAQKIKSNYYIYKSYIIEGRCFMFLFKIDSSIIAFENAKKYANLLNNKTLFYDANGFLGTSILMKGNAKEAIGILEETAIFYNSRKSYKKEATFLYALANAYNSIGEREKALTTILKVLKNKEEDISPEIIAASYNLVGSLYGISGQFAEALKYHKDYADIQIKNKNFSNTCSAYIAVSADYLQLNKKDSAFMYANMALAIARENKYKPLENKILLNLTSTQYEGFKGEERIELLKILKTYYASEGLQVELGNTLVKLALAYYNAPESYFSQKRISKDEKDILVASSFLEALTIAEKTNTYTLKEEVLNNLSTYYEKENNYIQAYKLYKKYIAMRDSALNESKQLGIAKLTMQFAFDKKEDSIKLIQANTNEALQQQSFLNKTQQQNILLQEKELLLNKQTLFSNNQQLVLLSKDKELQHLAFLKTQADLQTEQLQNSEKEKELTLVQKEKLLQSTQVKNLSQENELNKLRQRQLLFYGIAGLGSLLFAGLYLFNRNKAKQAQLKVELEKKEAEFQRSLADVSMSALRSQMNPHFIFNCLNSIKLYTTQNDNVAAANYLTKFSKLIRMALENSRSETVTLSAELESLELYIQMEAMRFKEKLKYSITIDKNVDSSFIEIPPMLLQPYVENAIWHGLMHKEEGGRIDVGVQVLPNEHTLAITVKDNGVGREKAAQLKSKTAVAHKSYGTKVTSERLDLINKIYKTGASVDIEDVLENGLIAGTLVTIKIPFE